MSLMLKLVVDIDLVLILSHRDPWMFAIFLFLKEETPEGSVREKADLFKHELSAFCLSYEIGQ